MELSVYELPYNESKIFQPISNYFRLNFCARIFFNLSWYNFRDSDLAPFFPALLQFPFVFGLQWTRCHISLSTTTEYNLPK